MKRLVIDLALIALVAGLFWGHGVAWGQSEKSRNPLPLGPFVGNWVFHDGNLSVDRAGHGSASFRSFVDCTPSIQTACDHFKGNFIYNGGFIKFTLGKVAGKTAKGSITDSAYSWAVFTPITITLNSAKDILTIRSVVGPTAACGARAAPGACGA
jgi:hypothetical protein